MLIPHLREMQDALLAWHDEHGMHAPWRVSGDPYQTMVAAVMAQQTQMSRVLVAYDRFIAAFPTIDALAAASAGDVLRAWAGMGYNSRALRLHNAAKDVVAQGWPRDAASLTAISGIGPFTAAIIASFAFGEPAACVDTNVRRVLGRISGDESIDGKRLQTLADASLAVDEPARWNQALMDYGARVCVVRPRCGECVIARWCASSRNVASTPLTLVADERAPYRASGQDIAARPRTQSTKEPPAAGRAARRSSITKKAPPFERSARYYRGRIIDALRALPVGETIALDELASCISAQPPPTADQLEALVTALARDGLITSAAGRFSLPD